MEELIKWEELTPEQVDKITWFRLNPPKYYKWFYKFYRKYIGTTIFLSIVLAGLLMIIFSDVSFYVVRGIFFFALSLIMWAASAKWCKHLYSKRYAKKIGLTMKQWNYLTKGMVLNI